MGVVAIGTGAFSNYSIRFFSRDIKILLSSDLMTSTEMAVRSPPPLTRPHTHTHVWVPCRSRAIHVNFPAIRCKERRGVQAGYISG